MPQKKIPAPKPCETCGGTFEVYPWQLRRGWGRFCSTSCGSKSHVGEANSNWRGDGVSYEALHYRLLNTLGPASDRTCKCGEAAAEWAYSHQDPNELRCPKGRPYSTNIDMYVPMCIPCHRKMDSGDN